MIRISHLLFKGCTHLLHCQQIYILIWCRVFCITMEQRNIPCSILFQYFHCIRYLIHFTHSGRKHYIPACLRNLNQIRIIRDLTGRYLPKIHVQTIKEPDTVLVKRCGQKTNPTLLTISFQLHKIII